MSRLVLVVLCELGVVEGFHVIPHFSPFDGLLGKLTVAKVIAAGDIALVLRLAFLVIKKMAKKACPMSYCR